MSAQISPKFPSFNWLRGVADDTRISILHRIILMRICLHRYNDSGKCDPGYDAVAAEVGVHRTTVIRAVEIGVRCGWLAPPIQGRRENASFVFTFPIAKEEVAAESDFKTTNKKSPQERLQDDQEVALEQSRSRSGGRKKSLGKRPFAAKSKASTGHGRLNGKKERGTSKSPKTPHDSVEKKKEAGGEGRTGETSANRPPSASGPKKDRATGATDGEEAFERFWAVYPRKVAKEAARKAFAKVVENGTAVETLIAGAQRYAVERKGQDPKYTKHPATWLNAGCWEDEAPGAPVIDQAGNVVAFEQEQQAQPSSRQSPLDIYEQWLEKNPSLRW
jgi:hypothetical protein